MPIKVAFADKASEDAFWAEHASNQSHNSGNHPSVRLVSQQPINRSSASYQVRSLFAKFNGSTRRRRNTEPLGSRPKPKPKWWSRRRAADNKKVNLKAFADRTIVSPFEEMALYGFITPVDLIEENDSDDDAPPITVTELQEWHDHHVTTDAMYTPWDVAYGIARSTRDLHQLQEQCVPDNTTSMHSPWNDKPVVRAAAVVETSVENKASALRRTNNSRNLLRDDAM
jgi:hypothetical protein